MDAETTERSRLKENHDWYYANLDDLLPRYGGKYIAFANGAVIGAYEDMIVAAQSAVDLGYSLGTFAVHKCIPKSEERPMVIASLCADYSSSAL